MKITRTAKTVCGRSLDIRGTAGTTGGGGTGGGGRRGGNKIGRRAMLAGRNKGQREAITRRACPNEVWPLPACSITTEILSVGRV